MGMEAPTDRDALDPDALLAHVDAVRRLAGVLVHDADRADDVTQETMRIALERGPKAGWPLSAWLGGVARNVARGFARADRRRTTRESHAARPPGAPSSDESVA